MAHNEFAYPSDLDSDVDSVNWDEYDDDADGLDSLSARLGHVDIDGRAGPGYGNNIHGPGYNLSDEDDELDHSPAGSPSGPLCVVCRKKPPFSKNGRSYPTCGLTCAAALSEADSNGSPLPTTPPTRSPRSPASRRFSGVARSERPPSYYDSSTNAQGQTQRSGTGVGSSPGPPMTPQRADGGRHYGLQGVQIHPPKARLLQRAPTVSHQSTPPRPRCIMCKRRSAYPGKPTCGLTCAEKLAREGGDSKMCEYCHKRPRNAQYPHCGQTCADKAKVACLFCKCRPRNGRYHLCGKTCKDLATKNTPLLLEAPKGHATFEMVEKKFKAGWKAGSSVCPEIKKVFKIIENNDFLRPYNNYRRAKRNEHFRYHGTKRSCQLGVDGSGQTKVCSSTSCAICNILKTSFKVSLANTSGAFGAGVYSSSASNKAFSYCGAGGSMLLTKVVLGKVRNVTAWNEVMSCPAGYDSVVFDRQNGTLNETIVYSDDAIRPVFLITF